MTEKRNYIYFPFNFTIFDLRNNTKQAPVGGDRIQPTHVRFIPIMTDVIIVTIRVVHTS